MLMPHRSVLRRGACLLGGEAPREDVRPVSGALPAGVCCVSLLEAAPKITAGYETSAWSLSESTPGHRVPRVSHRVFPSLPWATPGSVCCVGRGRRPCLGPNLLKSSVISTLLRKWLVMVK